MRNVVVVVVVVLALVAGAWFTIGPGAGAPTGACAPVSSVPLSSARPDPPADPPVVRWVAGNLPDGDQHSVRDVAVFAGALLAGGSTSPEPDSHAFVLRSTDGITWEGGPEDARRFVDAEMAELAVLGDHIFAIGSASTSDRGGTRVAVWFSDDGRSWREASGPFNDAYPSSLAAGPDGMLLVGTASADGVVRAWRSDDGEAWEASPLELPVPRNVAHLPTLAPLGDGWLSLGSISRGADAQAAPVAWRSDDGVTWSCQVLDAAGFPVVLPQELHRSGSGWLAIGDAGEVCGFGSCPGHPIAWVSADGVAWSPAILRGEPIEMGGTGFAGFDAGFVAVGGGTWLSADGVSWTRVEDEGTSDAVAGQADAVVLTDEGRIVAAGPSWIAVGELSR